MSSSKEIAEVYLNDIQCRNKVILGRPNGILGMMDGERLTIHRLYDGIMSRGDESLLRRMASRDREA